MISFNLKLNREIESSFLYNDMYELSRNKYKIHYFKNLR